MTNFCINRYVDADRLEWDAFVESSKNGTFLFNRVFMEYHRDRFVDASVLVRDERGKTVAVFPANQSEGCIFSHAGLTYGGMILPDRSTTTTSLKIFNAWVEYWALQGFKAITYKTIPPIYHRLPADEDKYALFRHNAELIRRDITHAVDLRMPLIIQERRGRGKKRAEKQGLVVRQSHDVEKFWTILVENLSREHGTSPVHSGGEMKLLMDRFPQNIELHCIFQDDVIIAGTLIFKTRNVAHAQYIASSLHGREVGALDLLFISLLDHYKSEVFYFDFGISNEEGGRVLNEGLADFKEGFGARAIAQDFYRLNL